jgi:hypothetical protein
VLRGELLGFALVRHDAGISDTASNYLSQQQAIREDINVRNWDESNGGYGEEEDFEMHLSLDDLIWNMGAIRVADTQRNQSGWVRFRLELTSET